MYGTPDNNEMVQDSQSMGQELKTRPAKYEAGVYVSNASQSSVRKYVCFKCDFTNNNADLLHTNLAGRHTTS